MNKDINILVLKKDMAECYITNYFNKPRNTMYYSFKHAVKIKSSIRAIPKDPDIYVVASKFELENADVRWVYFKDYNHHEICYVMLLKTWLDYINPSPDQFYAWGNVSNHWTLSLFCDKIAIGPLVNESLLYAI